MTFIAKIRRGTSLATGRSNNVNTRRRGFTLVELLLVMTMMVVVMSVVSPQLRGFFQGRDLDSESVRLLSLTRLGQSRAVAEGVPVDLWIDAKQGSYGLAADGGYTETQTNPVVYHVASGVQISASQMSGTVLTQSNVWTFLPQRRAERLPKIRFQPDGMIGDSSPETIQLQQGEKSKVWLVENTNHLRYEIQNAPSSNQRRR